MFAISKGVCIVNGRPFQSSKARACPGVDHLIGSDLTPKHYTKAGKACQEQTLQLIMNINKLCL